MSDKKEQLKLVEITLAKPHTHAGVPYAAGEKIKVTEADRDWLQANAIVNAPEEAKAK